MEMMYINAIVDTASCVVSSLLLVCIWNGVFYEMERRYMGGRNSTATRYSEVNDCKEL